jgi:hypothetical protein
MIKKKYIGLHVKYPLFLSDFNDTWNFVGRFSKNTQISIFMRIHPVTGKLSHAEGRTDMTKLIVAFHNIAEVPKNCQRIFYLNLCNVQHS